MYIGLHPKKKKTFIINKKGLITMTQTSINSKLLFNDFLELNDNIMNEYSKEKEKESTINEDKSYDQ